MPKDTFYNLPEEKRDLVMRCSYEEFARRDYRSASLSRIVSNAGIAKGSVYQYFENKLDLYAHLVDVATTRKLEYLESHARHIRVGFFERFREIVFLSLKFNLENPFVSHILFLAAREAPTSEIAPVAGKVRRDAQDFTRRQLEIGVAEGDLRVDIDLSLASYLLSEMSIRVEDFLEHRFRFSYEEVLATEQKTLPVPAEDVERTADSFIDLLRYGFGSRTGEFRGG